MTSGLLTRRSALIGLGTVVTCAPSARSLTRLNPGDIDPSLDLAFEIVSAPGRDVPAEFAELAKQPNLTPVVLGDVERLPDLLYPHPNKRSANEVLAAAAAIDMSAWFKERETAERAFSKDAGFEWPPRGAFEGRPYGADALSALTHDLLTGQPLPAVAIGLFPTETSAEVPAYLDAGGWNAFPVAEVHVAIMRKWASEYGARLVGHGLDVLTFEVARPPSDRQAAEILAMEQYLYCNDIVDQGVGTIDALAATLLNGRSWFFWWD